MRLWTAGGRPRRPSPGGFVGVFCFLYLLCVSALLAEQPAVVRFAVIGDSGSGSKHQYQIAEQMVAWHERQPYELALMLGDNIYGFWWGGGNKKDFEKKFDLPYAELLARGVTFRAALGNHDTNHRNGQDLIEAYDRFHIDGPRGYYSFTAGTWLRGSPERPHNAGLFRTEKKSEGPEGKRVPLVEFFVLNTVRLVRREGDAEQLAWLEQALAASRARWRILYGHHPLYSTGKRHGANPDLRSRVLPLLVGGLAEAAAGTASSAPGVQVALAGHDHFYQRFHPQNGTVFFVCGSSGKLRRGNARPSAQVAAVEDRQRVFMLWEATAEELRFRAINEEGQAFDCGVVDSERMVKEVACY